MGTLAPLRTAPFGRLLGSYSINELGDVLGAVALAILVFDETGDPLATAGLFVAAKFLPAFVAPALTAWIDQLPMRVTFAALYAVEALCFLALAGLAADFLLPGVLLLALADGTLALTARSLTRAAVAGTLGTPALLRAGNGLINIAFAATSVGGAALAGLLVAQIGVRSVLLCDAVSFALVALLMLSCPGLPDGGQPRSPVRARLAEGLVHVRRSPLLRALLGTQALALVLFTLVVPVEVVYAKDTLDAGNVGFGLLMASWGAGMVVGSALFFVSHRAPPLVVVLLATALVGAGYLGMALVRALVPACGFSLLGGVGNGVQWVSVMTLLQERTPLELQARVSGLLESVGAAMPGLGFALGGVMTSVTDAPTTYAIAGAGVLGLVAVVAVAGLRPRPRPAAPSAGA